MLTFVMAVVIILVTLFGIFIFKYLVACKSAVSYMAWQSCINDSEINSDSYSAVSGTKNFGYVIENLLIPLEIDYVKFSSNLLFLGYEGDKRMSSGNYDDFTASKITSSVKMFQRRYNRPSLFPIWFIAAFPDIVSWLNSAKDETANIKMNEIFFNGIEEDKLDKLTDKESSIEEVTEIFKKMVGNYMEFIKNSLETQGHRYKTK